MQHPRQSGGPRGQSKVELTFLVFHSDLTLTFRLYISLHRSLLWRGRTKATALAVASCALKAYFAECRKQEVLRAVLL